MIKFALLEFISRGILWARILFVAFFMSAEEYGYAILLISAEALIGSFISYPQIKDLLMRQEVHIKELTSTAALFFITLPFSVFFLVLYFPSFFVAFSVVLGALFFGIGQILLYLHRIDNPKKYNRIKITAACVSTVVFFVVVPLAVILLPLVQASYCAVLASGFRSDRRFKITEVTLAHPWSIQARTWAIFGSQSLIANASIYGTRLIAGATLGLRDVGIFTINYMIGSGVTFYFAAVMIYTERSLSKKIDRKNLDKRLYKITETLLILWIGIIAYFSMGYLIWLILPIISDIKIYNLIDIKLITIIAFLFSLRAIVLVINPVVIAIGLRKISLLSSIVSGLVLSLLLLFTWEHMDLYTIVWIMLGASLAQVIVLILALLR